MPDLRSLLSPRSIAIIGVSEDPKTIRGRLLRVMLERGFAGPIYPVSRKLAEVQGLRTYASLAELPQRVDLAILCTPAEAVPEVLEECGRAHIPAALIIASGFAEGGGEAGGALQRRLREIAEAYDIAVCGPNSTGFLNTFAPLAACFSPTVENAGISISPPAETARRIGVTSQSGGFTFAFLSRSQQRPIGYSYMVSSGNEACLDGADYVDFMIDDARTDVFLMYMEGAARPARLLASVAKAADAGKPLIVLKAGRTEVSRRAAASHTGAMSGEAAAFRAVFREYGVVEADDIDQMLDTATAFTFCPLPHGSRAAVVSASGGGAVLMADALAAQGLELLPFDARTRSEIGAFLPAYGSAQNPIDLTATAIRDIGYARIIDIVRRCASVDMIVVIGSLSYEYGIEKDLDALKRVAGKSDKPIVFCTYSTASARAISLLASAGIAVYTSMPGCARALRSLADYAAFQRRWKRDRQFMREAPLRPPAPSSRLAAAGRMICEADAKEILAEYGVPRTAERLVQSADEAVAAAAEIGYPVALKAQSPELPHKTEAGAVVLSLALEPALREAYEGVMQRLPRPARQCLRGMLVQRMAPSGVEVIVGINRDPQFGPMMMIGLGGVLVELMQDFVLAPVPVTQERAQELIRTLRGARVFDGLRGRPAVDVEALAALVAQLSRFAAEHSEVIEEIDLNPVILHEHGLSIVDALMVKAGEFVLSGATRAVAA
ncbi:MAG: acetate--CoA ligase family protein [Betaproteobacteria bacterium]|nr:acetate--CoA ligase family protein [Betaproteobacteria bacterium]